MPTFDIPELPCLHHRRTASVGGPTICDACGANLGIFQTAPSTTRPSAAHVALVEAEARQRAEAEFQQREAEARAAVVAKVREAIESTVDNGEFGDASGHLGGDGFEAIADAAVEVFVEMLRNPPTRVEHADGRIEIRWPRAASEFDANRCNCGETEPFNHANECAAWPPEGN